MAIQNSRRTFLKQTGAAAAALALCRGARAASPNRPNIIIILADDMGYGDIQALNPEGKIKTPHLDRFVHSGMTFTDAHSSSSVCTPTRYGILTGRYNWRSSLKSGVLHGFSPRLIEQDRLTLPAMLKAQGYATACFGKWHLGMDWTLKDPTKAEAEGTSYDRAGWDVDFTQPIKNGPTAVGFDTFYGISASLDMPPYVFIDNERPIYTELVEKAFHRKGAADVDFEAIDVLPAITRKTTDYIAEHAAAGPFFVYFPLNAPHTPIVPTPEWQGKSGINPYCDFVMQVDDTVGQVMDALEKHGISENTLIFFTADNGCSPAAKLEEIHAKDHYPNYIFRGHKADIFDGGHHIPLLAHWPSKIAPGSQTSQLACLTDFMATCAELTGATVPGNAAEDSVSMLPALEKRDTGPLREAIVHHSINGSFAIRQGKWKLELCPGSGGWSEPKPGSKNIDGLPPIQLYDMEADIRETTNVQDQHPEIVERLKNLLVKYVDEGRSTPGAPQKNTGEVSLQP